MNVSLYQAAAAMNASARWQDMISENLAGGSAVGGRKQEISFSAIAAGLNPASQNGSVIPSASVGVNFQPGDLRPTGSQMDFAIDGSGFFEVQRPDGSNAYTRDGQFQLNAQGQLVTRQGYTVMSDGGPITVDPSNTAPLTIAPTGEVSQGADSKGKLNLMEFADPQKLTMISSGYFLANDPAAGPSQSTTSQVHQGFVEASNLSPTSEMANLISAMRMFEANQKVLQMQDERSSKAIADLGSPS